MGCLRDWSLSPGLKVGFMIPKSIERLENDWCVVTQVDISLVDVLVVALSDVRRLITDSEMLMSISTTDVCDSEICGGGAEGSSPGVDKGYCTIFDC